MSATLASSRIVSGIGTLINEMAFALQLTHSVIPERGTGSPTFTRATTATVMGYGPTANPTDGQTLLTVAANEARFVGARRISEGVWSNRFADGNLIPSSTNTGYKAEGARTNLVLNSATLVTQSITTTATPYTLSFKGTGTVTLSGTSTAGPLVGTGATDRVTLTFTPTAGSLTLTVSGTCTEGGVEAGSFASSYIVTVGTAVTRNVDIYSTPTASNIAAAAGSIYMEFTPTHAPSGTIALWGTYVDASNYTAILHDGVSYIFRKRIGGTNYDATIAYPFVSGNTHKVLASWGAAGTTLQVNDIASLGNSNTTDAQIAGTVQIGASGNSLQQPFGQIRNYRVW